MREKTIHNPRSLLFAVLAFAVLPLSLLKRFPVSVHYPAIVRSWDQGEQCLGNESWWFASSRRFEKR